MTPQRRGLGRGLGALIPNSEPHASTAGAATTRPVDVFFTGETGTNHVGQSTGEDVRASSMHVHDDMVDVPGAYFALIPIAAVEPNHKQPRQVFDEDSLTELADSIREMGVLQPIVIRQLDEMLDSTHTGKKTKKTIRYELIMGERRLRAAQQAGLTDIPAIVRQTADENMLRDALLENLHRANLNPLEEAAAYQQLLDDFHITQGELAKRIARSRPQIANTLRLLNLPASVQRRVAAGVLSAGHARALLGLSDASAMEQLAGRIVAEGLSVRATEEAVSLGGDEVAKQKHAKPRPGNRTEAVVDLQDRLSDRFDTRVTVNLGKRKGRVSIEFASVRDLNRILEVLAPGDPGLLK